MNSSTNFWKVLGPSILFAGAAIGVSHLVQATRAGAIYGIGLLGIVLFANAFKYPLFRFGPHYAAATGASLLEGYKRRSRWALALFGLVMLPTLSIIIAAITITTAGMTNAVLGLSLPATTTAAGLVVAAIVLLQLPLTFE